MVDEQGNGGRGMWGRGMGQETPWTACGPIGSQIAFSDLFRCPIFPCQSLPQPGVLRALIWERIREKAGGVRGMIVRGMELQIALPILLTIIPLTYLLDTE
jgi:hypothetical protein